MIGKKERGTLFLILHMAAICLHRYDVIAVVMFKKKHVAD
jgi:hypothetical protein